MFQKNIYQNKSILIKEIKNKRYLYLFKNFNVQSYHSILDVNDFGRILILYEKQIAKYINFYFDSKKKIKILIGGCGGGTIIRYLKKKFDECYIVGVDIIQNMPEIINNYFGGLPLDKFIAQKIEDYVKTVIETFDLVIIDVFSNKISSNTQKKIFLKRIYNTLNKNGVFIQHVYTGIKSEKIYQMVSEYFKSVNDIFNYTTSNLNKVKLYTNKEDIVFCCRK